MRRILYDRSDGWRVRQKDPILRMIPHIMPHRYDAQVYVDDTVCIDEAEKLIRRLRKEGTRILFLHIMLAAMIRTMVDLPKSNRFVRGRKVYARKEISFCFAIKKDMSLEGEETVVKIVFDPKDTLLDVVERANTAIETNKKASAQNKTDKAARAFNLLPSALLRLAMFIIRILDNHRLLPKFLIRLSPFHASAFVTDMGSLGVPPVYHHIYDFGTTSFFIAFGHKRREDKKDGTRKYIDYKIVVDERIGDGFYMATTCKRLKRYVQNPTTLLDPPKSVPRDDEIR